MLCWIGVKSLVQKSAGGNEIAPRPWTSTAWLNVIHASVGTETLHHTLLTMGHLRCVFKRVQRGKGGGLPTDSTN